jgi:hypothetical protein
MKNLSSIERKHILLGIILMWGAILLFILQNNDTDSLNTFKIFLPVFWGIFTVVTVVYVIIQSLLQHSEIKRLEEQSLSTDDLTEKDNRDGNANILKSANILALVAMTVGYFTSSLRNMPIQYTTYQPIIWVVILCFDVCMYMVALFKDEPKEEVVDKPENRVGVQIISIEEAVEYLENQGYEIENVERLGIESKRSDPALEDKSEEEIQGGSKIQDENETEPRSDKTELKIEEEPLKEQQKEDDEGKEENSESTEQPIEEKEVDIKSQNLPVTVSPTKNNPKVTVVVKKKQSRHNNNRRRKNFK